MFDSLDIRVCWCNLTVITSGNQGVLLVKLNGHFSAWSCFRERFWRECYLFTCYDLTYTFIDTKIEPTDAEISAYSRLTGGLAVARRVVLIFFKLSVLKIQHLRYYAVNNFGPRNRKSTHTHTHTQNVSYYDNLPVQLISNTNLLKIEHSKMITVRDCVVIQVMFFIFGFEVVDIVIAFIIINIKRTTSCSILFIPSLFWCVLESLASLKINT